MIWWIHIGVGLIVGFFLGVILTEKRVTIQLKSGKMVINWKGKQK